MSIELRPTNIGRIELTTGRWVAFRTDPQGVRWLSLDGGGTWTRDLSGRARYRRTTPAGEIPPTPEP